MLPFLEVTSEVETLAFVLPFNSMFPETLTSELFLIETWLFNDDNFTLDVWSAAVAIIWSLVSSKSAFEVCCGLKLIDR